MNVSKSPSLTGSWCLDGLLNEWIKVILIRMITETQNSDFTDWHCLTSKWQEREYTKWLDTHLSKLTRNWYQCHQQRDRNIRNPKHDGHCLQHKDQVTRQSTDKQKETIQQMMLIHSLQWSVLSFFLAHGGDHSLDSISNKYSYNKQKTGCRLITCPNGQQSLSTIYFTVAGIWVKVIRCW